MLHPLAPSNLSYISCLYWKGGKQDRDMINVSKLFTWCSHWMGSI